MLLQGVSTKRNHFFPINNLTHFYFFNCVFSLKNERARCNNFKNAFLKKFFLKGDDLGLHHPQGERSSDLHRRRCQNQPRGLRSAARRRNAAEGYVRWDEEEEAFLEDWCFQQDSEPSYRARQTQSWLQANVPNWITPQQWPPYSPDEDGLDYSI